jgi:tungstate transport system substrate-binding protein
MGETLQFADELGAYTLSDRGTYLATRSNLPGLIIAVGGSDLEHNPDPALMNYYSVIPLNPDRHAGLETRLAEEFAEWLTSSEIQEQIAQFGRSAFNQPLFYPCNKSCSTAKD